MMNDEDAALLRLIQKNTFECCILTNSQKNPRSKYIEVVSTAIYAAPKWPPT